MDFANHLAATKRMLLVYASYVPDGGVWFHLPSRHQRHPKFSNAVLFTQDFLLIDWFTVISTKITVSLNSINHVLKEGSADNQVSCGAFFVQNVYSFICIPRNDY